jgi:hypothetical protein
MKNVTLMLVVCVIAIKANAQNPFALSPTPLSALRYSDLTFGGTARGMGLAGAVGSLGADITDLSVNPAGLGLYRSSEVEITPSLFTIGDATNYFGTSSNTSESKLDIENFGVVFTHQVGQSYHRYGRYGRRAAPSTNTNNTSKWKTTSFAIAYNRLNNFNENFYYQGTNPNNSITDSWAQELNANGGTPPSQALNDFPFDAGLAYEDYLVNPYGTDSAFSGTRPSGGVTQTESDQITGSQNEFDISFGANYNDKLFLGVTLGIPTINYNVNTNYSEVAVSNSSVSDGNFQSLNYQQQLSTTGTGINAKFGVIYKVNDYLRLGIAAHTPTWYSLQDNYSSLLTSDIDSAGTINYYGIESPLGSYSYDLVTPWRLIGSATILFKQYGFISADYEYVDYTQAYYEFNNPGSTSDITVQNQLNQQITAMFAPASIFRVGAEFAYDIFRIRGGFAYYGSPYQAGQAGPGGDQTQENITGGVGLRLDHVFIDAAYVYSMANSTYYPYVVDPTQSPYTTTPDATVKTTTGNIVLTVGYKF